MTTKTFGRRGAAAPSRVSRPVVRPAAVAAVAAPAPAFDHDLPAHEALMPVRSLLADIPFLTGGLLVLLLLVFGLEKRLAFDLGKDGQFSVQSLIAFGAVSRDLVLGSGEWWRIGLAPLLHSSASHLLGNCFAMCVVSLRLEPMIGRGWFALIFMVSALGGVAGSLYGNPPDLPSVGASGAITGLVGALFVMSFHHRADDQRAMLKTAAFFGVPALLPLFYASSSGNVDYFAHAGGALAGGALGLTLCARWPADRAHPDFARFAALVALIGFLGSIVCGGIAATRYAAYRADAARFIPSVEMPANLKEGVPQSAELLARYPKDPRAHLIRAFALAEANRLSEAEVKLRATMAMASSIAGGQAIRAQAQAILAVVLLEQGRPDEARTLAAGGCRAKDQAAITRLLEKAKLCD